MSLSPSYPLLEIKHLKYYYVIPELEISKFLDQKIMEYLQARPSFEPNPIEKKVREDYWSFGREKHIIDGVDYSYSHEEVVVRAVDGVTVSLKQNESLSIIGETGSGKSSLLYAIINYPLPQLAYKNGEINYFIDDTSINLLILTDKEMEDYRGIHIGFIPQLPKESLNPWLKIGFQTGEVLLDRFSERQEIIKEKVLEYLGKVALPDPTMNYEKYVNQLSRGEAQRVCIAMALMTDPKLLLADEPLSALDTIIQANVIRLLRSLKDELEFSYIFASHNIGAAGQLGDTMAVMYGGEIIELQEASKFFEEPLHPYSKGLLSATPWYALQHRTELAEIPGEMPKPFDWPKGCKFHPRCPQVMKICKTKKPPRINLNGREVECFLYE